MKTVWIDDVTGIKYDNYDEAREAVLGYLDTDDYRDALAEVKYVYGIGELLKGFIHPDIGAHLYAEIMDTAERMVLDRYLIEMEVEDEEDEKI